MGQFITSQKGHFDIPSTSETESAEGGANAANISHDATAADLVTCKSQRVKTQKYSM